VVQFDHEPLVPTVRERSLAGKAQEVAKKVASCSPAAKAASEKEPLIAALKRCATQNLTFSAASEAVPRNDDSVGS